MSHNFFLILLNKSQASLRSSFVRFSSTLASPIPIRLSSLPLLLGFIHLSTSKALFFRDPPSFTLCTCIPIVLLSLKSSNSAFLLRRYFFYCLFVSLPFLSSRLTAS
jgi:hypothetical protein